MIAALTALFYSFIFFRTGLFLSALFTVVYVAVLGFWQLESRAFLVS